MKIDGKNYEFKAGDFEINKNELALTNKNMELLFNYFSNGDDIISNEELQNMFDVLISIDFVNNNDDALTNKEIEEGFGYLDNKFKNITTYDIKTFIKEVSVKIESKELAGKLKKKLNGATWSNKTTINLLKKINAENVTDVLAEYDKLEAEAAKENKDYKKETLTEAILKESTIPLFGTHIGIDTVKTYICKPLLEQAATLNMDIKRFGNYEKITDESKLNAWINNIKKAIVKRKNLPTTNVKTIGKVKEPFEAPTRRNMYNIPHKTKLLDIAQDYLGYQELTKAEYPRASEEDKKRSQDAIINNPQRFDDAWCAHFQSFIAKKAGMDIGHHRASVYKAEDSFVNWAKETNTWHPIKLNTMTEDNIKQERKERAKEIRMQLKDIHEGDYAIWGSYDLKQKGNYSNIEGEGWQKSSPSHIGIIESVNPAMGTITVIEGNANIYAKGKNGSERVRNKSPQEALVGNETYDSSNPKNSTLRETNYRDGVIRKVYTVEALVQSGYTGFIDNSERIAQIGKTPQNPQPDPAPAPNPSPAEAKSKIEPVKTFKLIGVDLNIVKETTPQGAVINRLDEKSVQALKKTFKLPDSQVKFQSPIKNSSNVYMEKFGYFFQNRPNGTKNRPHMGLDVFVSEYAKKPRQPVLISAPVEGVVISEQHSNGDNVGNTLIILGRDGRRYAFKHMANPDDYETSVRMPKVGTYIQVGDPLGYVGATGGTKLWHLHLEVMTDEAKKAQEKDPTWQKIASESRYSEIRGVVNPLDKKEAGPIADLLNQYKNRDKGIRGDYKYGN